MTLQDPSSPSITKSSLPSQPDSHWKFYTKVKDALVNGQRLENLTWRLMVLIACINPIQSMSLKKESKEETLPLEKELNLVFEKSF